MEQNEYISIELAKKLCDIGYPLDFSFTAYINEGFTPSYESFINVAPSIYDVQNWLRKKKNFAIVVESSTQTTHTYWINEISEYDPDPYYVTPDIFETYEDALTAAINKVLEFIEYDSKRI